MARVFQSVSAVSAAMRQMWEEFTSSTGGTYAARVMGAVLLNSTGGQPGSSDVPANIKSAASTAVVGHVVADASTAIIGSLYPSTAIIGGLGVSTAVIGSLAPSTVHVGQVGGHVAVVEATLTRTTDITQYTARDQVSGSTSAPTALTFASAARANGGSGIIIDAICIDKTAQATKANLELHLYDAAIGINNDNVPWAPASSDADNELPGSPVIFNSWLVGLNSTAATGNCACSVRSVNIPFVCGSTLADIYGCVVEAGTYTPIASEAIVFRLGISQD